MAELVLLGIVFGILGFAVYGLIALLLRSSRDQRLRDSATIRCCKILDRLRRQGQLSESAYEAFREELRNTGYELTPPVITAIERVATHDSPVTETPQIDDVTVILAEPVGEPEQSVKSTPSTLPRLTARSTVAQPIHPLDLPDRDDPTSTIVPSTRKPFADLMASFMEERNIRWGELASGVLIVGSAVGLVVSLRETLQDSIPYFPALLFMLITAAIHATGVYTLRRWRLRNTSRGILTIGLLLIPLNMLAACILSDIGTQTRAMTDPVYWLAVVIGITAFSSMTWTAGKCLLHRRHWPLLAGVMGCSVSLLVINRVPNLAERSLTTVLLTLLPTIAWVTAVSAIRPRQWSRTWWSSRSCSRVWLVLGVSSFAFTVAWSHILLRVTDRALAVVATTPAITLMTWMVSVLGWVVYQGLPSHRRSRRIASAAVVVLAGGLSLLAILVSISNPTMLLASCVIGAVASAAVSRNHDLPWLVVVTHALEAAAAWCVLHLSLNHFLLDRFVGWAQLQSALLSAESGWCFVVVGVTLTGIHAFRSMQRTTPEATDTKRLQSIGILSGMFIAAAGCILAVVTSLLNRQVAFDQFSATLLLSAVAISMLWRGHQLSCQREHAACAVALSTLFALLHGLVWNPFLAATITRWTMGIDCCWGLVFGITGAILGTTSAFSRKHPATAAIHWSNYLAPWAVAASWACMAMAAPHLEDRQGIAVALALLAAVALLLVAWSSRRERYAASFCLATFVLSGFATAELYLLRRPESRLWSIQHGWIQGAVLSLGCVVWSLVFARADRRRWGWLMPTSSVCHRWILGTLIVGCLLSIGTGLAPQVVTELVATVVPPRFFLADNLLWAIITICLLAAATMGGLMERPRIWQIASLLLLGTAASGLATVPFAAPRAVATALRWFVSVAGLASALVVGSRSWWMPGYERWRARNAVGAVRYWSREQTQQLINRWLWLVAGLVLGLTTVAVTRVVMLGGESLGGPLSPSLFGGLRKDVSYAGPIGIVVATLLWFAVTERRSLLASAGSCVFQYLVIWSVVLLFVSPHPKLASEWFLNVMQAASLGMSGYGLVWFHFRERIGRRGYHASVPNVSQLDVHVVLNCVLVGSLASFILARFYLHPATPAGWVNEAGGWLGFMALIIVAGLAARVWYEHRKAWMVLYVGIISLALVAFVASLFDRFWSPCPWCAVRLIAGGACLVMIGCQWLSLRQRSASNSDSSSLPSDLAILLSGAVSFAFAVRGAASEGRDFWYHSLCLTTLIVACTFYGCRLRRSLTAIPMVIMTIVMAILQTRRWSWFHQYHGALPHLALIGCLLLAVAWLGYYVRSRQSNERMIDRRFVTFPNLLIWFTICWISCGSLATVLTGRPNSFLATPLGSLLIILTVGLLILDTWNDRSWLPIWNRYAFMLAMAMQFTGTLVPPGNRFTWAALVAAFVVAGCGHFDYHRQAWKFLAKQFQVPRLAARFRNLEVGRAVWATHLLATLGCLIVVILNILLESERPIRYVAAFTPVLLGLGFRGLAGRPAARFSRLMAAGLTTFAGICLALADVSPTMMTQDPLVLPSRLVLAFTLAMFAHGWWLPRRVLDHSPWIETLRFSTVVTCGGVIFSFVALLICEFERYRVDVGCGMPVHVAVAIAVAILALATVLLVIAVFPQHDPLRLSLIQRRGYAYAAQVVMVMLVVHAFLTMPFLFQLGIRKYWPYLAMALAFTGVLAARFLKRRQLEVLSAPMFQAAAALPVATAAAFWAIDSRADASLVMLMAGMLYLLISITQASVLSGAAAVAFANVSLWLFYGKFPGLKFLEHPQLWLVPPALSVLVAGQIEKRRLSRQQLAMLRYICVTVIYVSATSEIFLQGLGERLWPPVVLALLAVAGMMCGVFFRVRAFLYLGMFFLLFAMTAMIAHAQQRLDHVWPWWAFGIGLGGAILALFGWFENRKNEMPEIRKRLNEWDG